MILTVRTPGELLCKATAYTCALGRGGIGIKSGEGDGITPVGNYPLRTVFYRPDRLAAPQTRLTTTALKPGDGWCDAPESSAYNCQVVQPFEASHEALWRVDNLYDIIVPLGFNDDPPRPGLGSAIFMHIARPSYAATEGCVALSKPDLLDVLHSCGPETRIEIMPPDLH